MRVGEVVEERFCNHMTCVGHMHVVVFDVLAEGDDTVEVAWESRDAGQRGPIFLRLTRLFDEKVISELFQAEVSGNLLLRAES